MESEEDIFTGLNFTELDDEADQLDTRVCGGRCGRPVRACLCNHIPSDPISTATQVLILQHPHEQRHRLATVPVLARCLHNCQILTGRRLRLGSSPLLDSLHSDAIQDPRGSRRAIFLFPGTESVPSREIKEWKLSVSECSLESCVMIVFDATWKHAKEMAVASFPFLSGFASCVCFDYDVGDCGGSIYDSELILRKEPFRGCMSTLEAVARALGILEPHGMEIEGKLIGVLKAMVQLQASHLKHTKLRPRMLKKKKKTREK